MWWHQSLVLVLTISIPQYQNLLDYLQTISRRSFYAQSTTISHLHEGSLTLTTSCVHLYKEEHHQCCSNLFLENFRLVFLNHPHTSCAFTFTHCFMPQLWNSYGLYFWHIRCTKLICFLCNVSLNKRCFRMVQILHIPFEYLHSSLN